MISIIIPTLDAPAVGQVIEALLQQVPLEDDFEVIVVDTRNAWDPPASLARNVRCLKLEAGSELHRSRALNTGARAAAGDLLLFLAGDFTPVEGFLEAHRQFHKANPEATAVAIGRARFIEQQSSTAFMNWLESGDRLFGTEFDQGGDANGFFYCANVSLKRELWERAGGFDEEFRFDSMEDYELGCRLRQHGMRSYFVPEAFAWHEHVHEPTLRDRSVNATHAGESAVVFERKHSGPYGWSNSCAHSPLRLEADALLWGGLYLIRRRTQHLHNYYSCRLDAAFVRGWRKARRST